MTNGFTIFGKGVVIVITLSLAAIVIETLTGFVVILYGTNFRRNRNCWSNSNYSSWSLPLVHFITKVFSKPLLKLGSLLGMNDKVAAGMIANTS